VVCGVVVSSVVGGTAVIGESVEGMLLSSVVGGIVVMGNSVEGIVLPSVVGGAVVTGDSVDGIVLSSVVGGAVVTGDSVEGAVLPDGVVSPVGAVVVDVPAPTELITQFIFGELKKKMNMCIRLPVEVKSIVLPLFSVYL